MEGYMGQMTHKIYTCEMCKKMFESAWSDEEARAEMVHMFPMDADVPQEELANICDMCYKLIIATEGVKGGNTIH